MSDGNTGRAAVLLRLARQVTARHDVNDILVDTVRLLRPLVGFGGGSIQLLDDEGWIQIAAADPPAPPHVLAQAVPLATSVAGRVVLTERAVYVADLEQDPAGAVGRSATANARSYLAIPLVADGAAVGVLQVDSPQPDAWDSDERELFASVAPVVAAAIQNARAHARVKAARTQVAATARRLHDARALVAELRMAVRCGSVGDLDDVVRRLELLVGEGSGAGESVPLSGLARPRVPVG